MANFTITIPDAAVPRLKTAMGHYEGTPKVWVDATLADIQAELKRYLKSQVINHETTQAGVAKNAEVSAESW